MQVTGTSSSTAASGQSPITAASTGSAPTVNYNAFLQLLIAQMKNQDPTNPTDSTQFLSQLASFSAVEQATQTNAKLDALLTSSALSQADSVIGRTLTSADGSVTGKVISVNVTATGSTAMLEDGKTVALGSGVWLS